MNTFTYTIIIIIVMAAILSTQQAAAAQDAQMQLLLRGVLANEKVPQEISTLLTGVLAEWQNNEEVPQEVSTLLTGVLTEMQNDEVPQEMSSLLTGLVFWLHQLLSEYEKTSIKAGKSSVHHYIAKAEKGTAAAIPESLFENMSISYSWAEEELSMPLSTAEEMSIGFGQTVKMSKAFKTKASKGVRMLEKASKATKTQKIR